MFDICQIIFQWKETLGLWLFVLFECNVRLIQATETLILVMHNTSFA